jgi:type IV pilus assembly protein PilW
MLLIKQQSMHLTVSGDRSRSAAQGGFTIVELMISITISVMVLAGLVTLFANNSRTRTELERANQQSENGRYALQILTSDLGNAGYFATFNPTSLATPAAKPDACATTVAALTAALPMAIQGYDEGASAPTCLLDVKVGTDIIVTRRASTCAVGATGCDAAASGSVYFQASTCNSTTELRSGNTAMFYAVDSVVANLTRHSRNCTAIAPYYTLRTHIYFIANNDKSGDGIPTLKRAELIPGDFVIVPLVEGIESLQLEYGVDTASPNTGSPAVYTANPDTYLACVVADCMKHWRNTVAVKIHVLARNKTISPEHVESKTYNLGLTAAGLARTAGPFTDKYKRHVYSSVVRLNNPAGRLTP